MHFISLEKHPFQAADLALAQAAWQELAPQADALRRCWPALEAGEHYLVLDGGRVRLTLYFGDAVTTLRRLDAKADAFYLDGFSPARNPQMWSPELCVCLGTVAVDDATLATWSVAGSLRRALAEAGFKVSKRPGFAGKRQMLVGHYLPVEAIDHRTDREITRNESDRACS